VLALACVCLAAVSGRACRSPDLAGPALYWSDRVGRHNRIFKMPKFRSMRIGTPAVATHLLTNPDACLTPHRFFFA
jgi:lipopolysaccharide/colanic/teichoic acid biosynthesis glycosyltransferase